MNYQNPDRAKFSSEYSGRRFGKVGTARSISGTVSRADLPWPRRVLIEKTLEEYSIIY